MSPVLNCIPSSPPSDGTYPKGGSVASDGSKLEIRASEKDIIGDLIECPNEEDYGEDTRAEESKRSGLTNNNSIPLNCKKSPSPNEGIALEAPIRPWSSSPSSKSAERDQSVSPSSSGHHPSPCPPFRNSVSPDVSSENSRLPSHASSEAQEAVASPDSFRTFKMSAADIPGDIPLPYHENRFSSDSFRLSNTFIGDPINPYLRLSTNSLNPFQTPPAFLGNPFLGASDPKLLLNNSGLGLFTQQLHHLGLNGLSSNVSKMPPLDLQRMSMQQLQFLHHHLQSLPTLLHSSPYSKFPEPRNQLSMLVQARKHPKFDSEGVKNESYTSTSPKLEEVSKLKDRRIKHSEMSKSGKASMEERMDISNYEDNNSDSDELLSVGSVSPPPHCQVALSRTETDIQNCAGLSGLNSFMFPTRKGSQSDCKKYSNSNGPGRLQNNLTKPVNTANRILKFSIDNILKSDFGSEEGVKKPKQAETKKEDEKTFEKKKKPETEQETSVDLGQDNANSTPGTDTPMLWPAWVYCTRYSDRPSSGTERSISALRMLSSARPETPSAPDSQALPPNQFRKPPVKEVACEPTIPTKTETMTGEVSRNFNQQLNQKAAGYSLSPRTRRSKNKDKNPEEKRPRTAFSGDQLSRLKHEFAENRYLTERRRQDLARELGLNEAQIKIWFQNKRAKMKKARGEKNPLALQLMAQGLYNHSTVPLTKEEEEAAAAELSD